MKTRATLSVLLVILLCAAAGAAFLAVYDDGYLRIEVAEGAVGQGGYQYQWVHTYRYATPAPGGPPMPQPHLSPPHYVYFDPAKSISIQIGNMQQLFAVHGTSYANTPYISVFDLGQQDRHCVDTEHQGFKWSAKGKLAVESLRPIDMGNGEKELIYEISEHGVVIMHTAAHFYDYYWDGEMLVTITQPGSV